MSPDLPQFHYLRAQILQGTKRYKEAIDAYDSTIGLAEDINSINSEVFRQLSASYAALGEYCEAITPIQTWMALDPPRTIHNARGKFSRITAQKANVNCLTQREAIAFQRKGRM